MFWPSSSSIWDTCGPDLSWAKAGPTAADCPPGHTHAADSPTLHRAHTNEPVGASQPQTTCSG